MIHTLAGILISEPVGVFLTIVFLVVLVWATGWINKGK